MTSPLIIALCSALLFALRVAHADEIDVASRAAAQRIAIGTCCHLSWSARAQLFAKISSAGRPGRKLI